MGAHGWRIALGLCGALMADRAAAVPAGEVLDQTARFLAAKPPTPESKGMALSETAVYRDYAEGIRSGWQRFQAPNLERMRSWWAPQVRKQAATVFYPFSGPDIANALALFPDAELYLLFGLEAPGVVPELEGLSQEELSAGLNSLRAALNTIFQVNYFITKGMEKKLGKGSFNSITGLLLFFLAMSDREVLSAEDISVGPHVPGVEIRFRRAGAKVQTLRYFMVNVADASLAKSAPGFLPYLMRQGRFATLIKSASYLLHKDGLREPARFDQIREVILGKSDLLIQDDSGVPLRLFARDRWKLTFHGRYDAPTREFEKYLQKDLRTEMQRNSTGKLPFSYGYDYQPGESNLMIAELR